jgi:alcohol dehydrogenase class IV
MVFDFSTAARVVFRAGCFGELEGFQRAMGRRPLLVSGAGGERFGPVVERLGEAGAWVRVIAEPDFEGVRRGVAEGRAAGCDCVVALGGGSVIDAGKAMAMLLANGGDPLDYAELIGGGLPVRKASVPWIAVPTTAGAGSEVTRNAVLKSLEHGLKVSLRSALMFPTLVLVDPELTLGLPPAVTAATGMDALSQVLEAFVSCRANPMTDALAREGLVRIGRSLRRVYGQGRDLEARSDMAFGALIGGMTLANAGLGAVHGFAAPIGGAFEAPHGAVCAALLAPVMEMNVRRGSLQTQERYLEVARRLTGRDDAGVQDGLDWVRGLAQDLGIPRLSKYGIEERHVARLVEQAAKASSMRGNPVGLSAADLEEVLRAAL